MISDQEECKPIYTLKELLDFQFSDGIPNVISCAKHKKVTKSKVLVCHDMKGGYLDDRFVNGSDNANAYRFYQWPLIDLFVYFSHHFVTIPPSTWINAAHKNGVQVLGTIITEEWAETGGIIDIFENAQDLTLLDQIAKKLVDVAIQYQFDGWLINIESKLKPFATVRLVEFLNLLTQYTRQYIPNGIVIWYDSVIHPSGELKWQNELNSLNKCFFDVCDGIFLNYTWKPENLAHSRELALKNNRIYDVYVGIDVFGRGSFGGGGFKTYLAIEEIRKHDLSIALFAPGWTYEANNSNYFDQNERIFWKSLKLQVSHVPTQLPLITSFCQGFGKKLFKNGQVINGKPWFNLNKQQIQPSTFYQNDFTIESSDAFNGGGSLYFYDLKEWKNVFTLDINLIKKCIFASTYKSCDNHNNNLLFNLVFKAKGSSNTIEFNHDKITIDNNEFESNAMKIICCCCLETSKQDEINKYLLEHEIDMKINSNWRTEVYLIEPLIDEIKLTAINVFNKGVELDGKLRPNLGILLGQLALIEVN